MDLTIPAAAASHFSSWMIERLPSDLGQGLKNLFSYLNVDLSDGDDGWLWVCLRSYQTTWVALKPDGERLLYQCGCERFKEIAPRPCEHVVAAIISLERQGGLSSPLANLSNPISTNFSTRGAGVGKAPSRRLKTDAIAAATEEVYPYLVQDSSGNPIKAKIKRHPPIWKPYFKAMRDEERRLRDVPRRVWPSNRQLLYVIDVSQTLIGNGVVVDVLQREPKKAGGWKTSTPCWVGPDMLDTVPESDREPLTLLAAAAAQYSSFAYRPDQDGASKRKLTEKQASRAIPLLCGTGRCFLRPGSQRDDAELLPLRWDDGPGWDLTLDVRRDEERACYVISGSLRRDQESLPLEQPIFLTAGGFVFWPDAADSPESRSIRAAALNDHGAFEWAAMLRERKKLRVPFGDANELLIELFRFRSLPRAELPEELRVEQVTIAPQPRLAIKPPRRESWQPKDDRLVAELSFNYGGDIVKREEEGSGIFKAKDRRMIRRDDPVETAALRRLNDLGIQFGTKYHDDGQTLRLQPKHLPGAVRALLAENWHVEAEGKLYRQPGELRFDVSSGIDWFDLNVTADFGGAHASLPRLLAALRRGESMVQLDDGTFGILPEEWLKKFGPLAGVAKTEGDSLRFTRAQAGLLDAMLASQPAVSIDETFQRVRNELAQFNGIRPLDPPATFIGSLRPYQRESLGWFDFLRRFGFGGCLADDMGLGKTVQILALLEDRRASGVKRPSLVVVPRSLIFNWTQEAARFAPNLRVLDQSHAARVRGVEHLANYDLILSTYGTLRRDSLYLKDLRFDYAVLDEAQAVKNADSESAKAVRLLQADHRMVLSGTPVQNHLGDLWSLFEFLNPGLLGSAAFFAGSTNDKSPDIDTRQMLARGLRPFILRRTKDQVAPDLPPRQEQTIYCELEGEQRKLYDELRNHYRSSLLGLIDKQGLGKSKIQILEALLRLRQAACHPALISRDHAKVGCAKLETLIPRLRQVLEGGHKALIFSQFTTFLTLVKQELKPLGVDYEYLDGKTKDRQARVERFQTDPQCKLFLISLKAGGVGLNLTAADYCFLLDPWWNPAVEAQAIDRAHRIGQTKHVFACRLIAKGTVEEKVLALQQSKRELADAIIGANNAVMSTLGREDLELLLS